MSFWKKRTEHNGPKNRCAKGGYYGYRADAKADCRKGRRMIGKLLILKELMALNLR